MGTKLAAIYARLSRDRDTTHQKVEDQIADCRALAERLDMIVLDEHVYRDDSISAHSGRLRPGYEKLLTAIRSDEIDAVIVTETERLDRRLRNMLDYLEAVVEHDVETYAVRAGKIDLTTRAGRLNAKLKAVVDEDYAEQAAERMRESRRHRVSRGQWTGGRRPFGYRLAVDPHDRRPHPRQLTVLDKREAAILRWAAASILAGSSLNTVCAKLNRKGIRTSTGHEWKPTELRRVLARPRNAGLMQLRTCGQKQERGKHHHNDRCWKIVGKAEWPAILDEDIWRGVCAVFSDPARRSNTTTARHWLGSGIYRCGWTDEDGRECGGPIKSFSASAKRRPVKPVYTCRTGKHVIRTAEEVDAYIEEIILERLQRPDAADLLVPDQTGDTSALHLKDAALAARLAELGRMFAAGEIEADTLRAGTEDIRQQRERITVQLTARNGGSILSGLADAADPAKVWAGLDLSRKREVIRVLVDVVVLPAKRGRRAGWRAGESYFDPSSVRVTWKR
jgi:site-specific DNA recombinase